MAGSIEAVVKSLTHLEQALPNYEWLGRRRVQLLWDVETLLHLLRRLSSDTQPTIATDVWNEFARDVFDAGNQARTGVPEDEHEQLEDRLSRLARHVRLIVDAVLINDTDVATLRRNTEATKSSADAAAKSAEDARLALVNANDQLRGSAVFARSQDYEVYANQSARRAWFWRFVVVACASGALLVTLLSLQTESTTVETISEGITTTTTGPSTRSFNDNALIYLAASSLGGVGVWAARQAHDANQETTAAHDFRMRLKAIEAYYAPLGTEGKEQALKDLGQLLFAQPTIVTARSSTPTDPSLIAELFKVMNSR